MKVATKRILGISLLGLISALSTQGYASGYKVEFQSASVLADAGEAAVINDASTNWYNSAGLVYLPQQYVFSVIDVYAPATFKGTASAPNNFVGGAPYSATGTATSHPNSILPGIHYSLPLNERFAFGISVAPAWGFIEDYGGNSIVKYELERVQTKSLDISPSLAMKINDQWSVGAGPDFHYWSVQTKSRVFSEGPSFPGTASDSVARYSANSWDIAWHAGVLFRLNDRTRFGLNYRSKIINHLEGYSDFEYNGVASLETNKFYSDVPMPPTTTFSVYHEVTPVWAVMGTIAYDQWSVLRAYNGHNYQFPDGTLQPVTLVQDMHNTFDYSVGTHYRLNPKVLLRASIKYENTPTNDRYRDVTFPDGQKLGLNIGARYQATKKLAFDVIYGHVFTKRVVINGLNPATNATTSGHSTTDIDLLGAQLVYDI